MSEDDLLQEVSVAYRAALAWAQLEDFEAAAREGGGGFLPGTLVDAVTGEPWLDRGTGFEVLADFVYWRLSLLAEQRQVRVCEYNSPMLPPGSGKVATRLRQHEWAHYFERSEVREGQS